MTDLKKTAQKLAAKGRYGDSMLLHVSPAEVAGLASLIPGGKLPVNPRTGLPEAWFFLPFLSSLFGAAAPAAAAATAAAPVAASALGAGAAAGTAAAGTAATLGATGGPLAVLGKGIGALGKGVGSLFGFGAPAVDPIVTSSTAAAGAPAAGGLSSLTAAGASPGSILPASPAATAPIGFTGPVGQVAGPLNPLRPAIATPTGTLNTPLAGQPYAGSGTATLGHAGETSNVLAKTIRAGTTKVDPWAGLKEVTATEAPKTGKGGLGGLMTMDNALKGMIVAQGLSGLFKKSGGKNDDDDDEDAKKYDYNQESATFPDKDYDSGLREWNFYPNSRTRSFANGGIVRLAAGGIVPGATSGVDLQAQMPQDMTFPQNGIGSLGSPEQIPESPFPTSQIGAPSEPGNEVNIPTDNDKELIAQTIEAIQGKIPNPEQIMLAFVKEFGEAALQDLVMRVQTMMKQGKPNDGTSDSIPAMIDGQQPAALSEGEYVVPADVVSGMGNGSTNAGAKQLDGMVGGIRQQRTGTPRPPPNFNAGGLVSLMGR